MNRRKFIIGTSAGLASAASGALILTKGFTPPEAAGKPPELLKPENGSSSAPSWIYHQLDLNLIGNTAYHLYSEGSCMYAVFGSIIKQLADKFGEPYSSFPYAMMKYGATGIGGYGSVCGALNGAAAAVGLFVNSKPHRNAIIENFFSWYEKTTLPIFKPKESPFVIDTSVSNSVLCHASTANWIKASGHRIDSKERSERCSRLSADVAQKTAHLLNDYFDGCYKTSTEIDKETGNCMQCHSQEGKLGDIRGKMECSSCHEKSLAHTLFADVHYKFME